MERIGPPTGARLAACIGTMAKLYRQSAAPAGADMQLRNPRLYGGRDEQIAGAALRARGCPNEDRGYVRSRPRAELRRERETAAFARSLQEAQSAMLAAQRAVKRARALGRPAAEIRGLAYEARTARAAYLRLTGGVERRAVDVNTGSETNPVRAV